MAKPSPREAPVTRATRFSSENIFVMTSSNKKAGKLPAFPNNLLKFYFAMQVSAVSGVQTSRPV